jgi:hypothetical protein
MGEGLPTAKCVSDLGLEAQALIRTGRSALRPTAADRERVAEALRALIEAAGGAQNAPATAIAQARSWGWSSLSALVAAIGVGGLFVAGAFGTFGLQQSPRTPAVTTATTVASPDVGPARTPATPEVSVPPPPSLESAPVVAERIVSERTPTRGRKVRSDRLAEEVEILSRAATELHRGQLTSALGVLEEHARKFPRGALTQERRAAQIQALCGLGRVSEADAELARLSPGSLHEGSARAACSAVR